MTTRATDELRRYDLVKLIVLLILIALLLCLVFGLPQAWVGTAPAPTPTTIAQVKPSATSAPPLTQATLATPSITSPKTGDVLTDDRVTVTGISLSGSTVQLLVNSQLAGATTVGADGNWALEVNFGQPGNYEISAQAVDASGQPGPASSPVTVSLAPPTSVAPTATSTPTAALPTPTPTLTPTLLPSGLKCSGPPGTDQGEFWLVADCDTLSYISRRTGIPLDKLIKANPQIKDPDLIFPDQRIILPR